MPEFFNSSPCKQIFLNINIINITNINIINEKFDPTEDT